MLSVNHVFGLQISLAGTVQIQERQKTVEKIRVNGLDSVRDLLYRHERDQPFTNQVSDNTCHKSSNNKLFCCRPYITIIINSFFTMLLDFVTTFMHNAYFVFI